MIQKKEREKKHEFGCRFYVRGEFLKYVKDFKIMNQRVCYWRLKAKSFSSTFLNVHAPTKKKNRRGKWINLQFIRAKYKSNS